VLRKTVDGVSIITAPAFNFSFAAIPRPVAGKSFGKKNPKKKDHESKYETHNEVLEKTVDGVSIIKHPLSPAFKFSFAAIVCPWR